MWVNDAAVFTPPVMHKNTEASDTLLAYIAVVMDQQLQLFLKTHKKQLNTNENEESVI